MNYKPYTYLLKCHNGQYYYGVKFANNKSDVANPDKFWKTYFTSCCKVKDLIKTHGVGAFEFEIRKVFETAEFAIRWESNVNKRLTTKSNKFLNDSYLDGRIQIGERNGHYGKKHSLKSLNMAVETRRRNGSYNSDTGNHLHNTEVRATRDESLRQNNAIRSASHAMGIKLDHKLIVDELSKFDFPDMLNIKTLGSRPSESSYFSRWYVEQFPDRVSMCKTPYNSVLYFVKKHMRVKYDPK